MGVLLFLLRSRVCDEDARRRNIDRWKRRCGTDDGGRASVKALEGMERACTYARMVELLCCAALQRAVLAAYTLLSRRVDYILGANL